MAYQLRLRLRAVAFIDMFLSGLSIIFFLVAMWFLTNEAYEKGFPMVIGIFVAILSAGLKAFGVWTCWKLIKVINRYYQNEDLTDWDEQLEFTLAWNWLKTKVSILIVPVLTLGFILKDFRECLSCLGIAGGWIVVEIILISLGRVYMLRN